MGHVLELPPIFEGIHVGRVGSHEQGKTTSKDQPSIKKSGKPTSSQKQMNSHQSRNLRTA